MIDFQEYFQPFIRTTFDLHPVARELLPPPFNVLLTQPLMTPGLEQFYSGTGRIQVLYTAQNKRDNTYSRVILMVIDKNGVRNEAKNTQVPVELALITINFDALSSGFIDELLNTDTPFGRLLLNHHFNTKSRNRQFYSLICNEKLSTMIHCQPGKQIYARTHTLINADNQQWLAQVLEILPGHTPTDPEITIKH